MSLNLGLDFSGFNLEMDKPSAQKIYEFDGFRLDAHHLILSHEGNELELAPKAIETLLVLIKSHGNVVTKDELLGAVWPDTIVDESNLFTYLSHLRKALGNRNDGKPYIETLRRRGYRFNADTRIVETATDGDGYAWVVDDPDDDGEYVQTRSGRLYLLKDSNGNRLDSTPTQHPIIETLDTLDQKSVLNRDFFLVRRRWLLGASALVGAVIISVLGFYISRRDTPPVVPSIKTVAVLPFRPITEHDSNPGFEMGMADDLINKLTDSDGLSVRSIDAVKRFASVDRDPIVAGRELKADVVLDCSSQISGSQFHIVAKLINVADSKLLWSESFDGDWKQQFEVQNKLAERVAIALTAKLSSNARKRFTESPEAYQLYQDGRFHLLRLAPPSELKLAIDKFRAAIAVDPNYALAYAGLARAYMALVLSAEEPPGDRGEQALMAADTAVQLDPTLAEGHAMRGGQFTFGSNMIGRLRKPPSRPL